MTWSGPLSTPCVWRSLTGDVYVFIASLLLSSSLSLSLSLSLQPPNIELHHNINIHLHLLIFQFNLLIIFPFLCKTLCYRKNGKLKHRKLKGFTKRRLSQLLTDGELDVEKQERTRYLIGGQWWWLMVFHEQKLDIRRQILRFKMETWLARGDLLGVSVHTLTVTCRQAQEIPCKAYKNYLECIVCRGYKYDMLHFTKKYLNFRVSKNTLSSLIDFTFFGPHY